jgi:hypothetical protein
MCELLSRVDIAPGDCIAELGILVKKWYVGAVENLEGLMWVGATLTVSVLLCFPTCCYYVRIKRMILRLEFVLVC